ncbi:PTS sugar transporter subunit IIA [Dokdonella sp.]|uniref:PTS sugar transporter subunit IIA n=1 Tax=Dokdonella sp. TaxID=2291710 RepID=UPI003528982B
MSFLDLLTPERVRADLVAADKTELLAEIATLLAGDQGDEEEINQALQAREDLGSTGLGHGVAIPHGRIEETGQVRAVFIKLQTPLEFDALDAEPVDLVAALVVPTGFADQHLLLLAELAEMFSDRQLTADLREAGDASAVIAKLAEFKRKSTGESAWTD